MTLGLLLGVALIAVFGQSKGEDAATWKGGDPDQKLHDIFISLDFTNATIEEGVNFLWIESRRLDYNKQGIQIVVHPSALKAGKPITLVLYGVPLGEALRYVCAFAHLKLKVGKNAVHIFSLTDKSADHFGHDFTERPSGRWTGETYHRLQVYSLEKLDFQHVDVAVALRFLQEKCKEMALSYDDCINLILEAPPETDHPIHRWVDIKGQDLTIREVLAQVVRQTNLHYTVEGNVIYFKR